MAKGQLARKVSVIGADYTPMGDVRKTEGIKDFSEREMLAMAAIGAMKKANIEAKEIDAFYVGMSGPSAAKMKGAAPFFAEWIGMKNKPTMFMDAGCVSGGIGMGAAIAAVAGGVYDCVLCTGVNINFSVPRFGYPPYIRDELSNADLWDNVYTGIDAAYVRPSVGGLSNYDALVLCYLKEYGYTTEQFDDAIINYLIGKREEAVLNEKFTLAAQSLAEEGKNFGFDSAYDYMKSKKFNPYISHVGRAKVLGWAQDGASAVIVCASDIAGKYTDKPVEVAGYATSCARESDAPGISMPDDMNMFRDAYAMAGITDPYQEIEHMYIHDCPSILLPIVAEEAGYIKPGEALDLMMRGGLQHDGERPINTSGGRAQGAHPRSPAYLLEISEAVDQIRGEAGDRQMPTAPKTSLLWGGGTGASKMVTVLKKQW